MRENIEEIREAYHKALDDYKKIRIEHQEHNKKMEELEKEIKDLLSGK